MEITYEWQREHLKKKLERKRMKTNIIFLILGILLFLYITYSGFIYQEFDNWIIMLGFIIYIFLLVIILLLTTKWYVRSRLKKNDKKTDKAYGEYKVIADDNNITATWHNGKITYHWSDITKLKIKKNYFWIRTDNDRIGLIFYKNILHANDYEKLLNYIKEHIKR